MTELERLRADLERLRAAITGWLEMRPNASSHVSLQVLNEVRAALAETKPANPETEPRRCGIEFKPFGENSFIMSTACKLEAGHAGAHRQSATLTPGGPRTVLDSVPAPTTPEPHPEYLRGLEDAAKLADEGKHDEWSPDYIGRMIRQLAACAAPLATEPKR